MYGHKFRKSVRYPQLIFPMSFLRCDGTVANAMACLDIPSLVDGVCDMQRDTLLPFPGGKDNSLHRSDVHSDSRSAVAH